jgi:hypothetical protein
MLRSISAALVCAASISVQAFEVQLPQYISPGEQVVMSAGPIAQYDEFAWQSSSFNVQLQSYGDKQQFAALKLPKYANDSQISVYTYGLQGWSYETQQNVIEVRANKPKLPSSIDLVGPSSLLLDQPNIIVLQGVAPNTNISWQAVDDNGSDQGVQLQSVADNQLELSLDSAAFQGETIHVLATINLSGWQYQVTQSFNLEGQTPPPNLVINTQNTYQEFKAGTLSALVEHTLPDDEVTFKWRVIAKGNAETVQLSTSDQAQTQVQVDGIDTISKVTLAVNATIRSTEKTVSLNKEFDISVLPNKAPTLSFNTTKTQLWAGESMALSVTSADPEQDAVTLDVQNLSTDLVVLTKQGADYVVTAKAITSDEQAKFKLMATDEWGNETFEAITLPVRRLPTVSFSHLRRLYAYSPGTLKAAIDVPMNNVKKITWQQRSGEQVQLTTPAEMTTDFMAKSGGSELSFAVHLTLSEDVTVSANTNLTVLSSQRLNDTGDVLYVDKLGNWSQDIADSLAGLDALAGRDAASVLLKQGAGPQGFDFNFLNEQGDVVAAFSTQASCLRDNHTGFVWLLKTAANGDLQSKQNINQINSNITALNEKQRCGMQTWRLPNAEQLLSVLSTHKSEHTLHWLTATEAGLGQAFSRLQLLSATKKAGQSYIINWHPSTLTSSWMSSQNAYHFLLMAGE